MRAADVMVRNVVTATPETTIEDLVGAMIRRRISGVPVLDDGGALVGIVTEGDLLRRTEIGTERAPSRWLGLFIAPGRLARNYVRSHGRRVKDVMTGTVVSVVPDTPLAEVVALMESRRIKRLPVVEDGKLVGIISRVDLLKALADLLPKVPARAVSDAEIRRRVLADIDREPWAPSASIDAKVENGIVELCGTIMDEREREALRVAAENVPGVKRVRDRLVCVEPISGVVIDAPPLEETISDEAVLSDKKK